MRRTFLLWVALSARCINRSSPYQVHLMLACLCMRAYTKLAVTTSQCGKFPAGQMFSTIAMFQRHMISYTTSRTQSAERNSTATCPRQHFFPMAPSAKISFQRREQLEEDWSQAVPQTRVPSLPKHLTLCTGQRWTQTLRVGRQSTAGKWYGEETWM